jgi:3D (Asp-Asp-Asp) domain-containing protein
MTSPVIIVASLLLLPAFTLLAEAPAKKLKVRVTHYGYPGDPNAGANTRLGFGDHNNILNPDSVAVSPDLDHVFPFGSKVIVNGRFIGFRHDTTSPKLHHTIAVYDPNGEWKEDSDAYIEVSANER